MITNDEDDDIFYDANERLSIFKRNSRDRISKSMKDDKCIIFQKSETACSENVSPTNDECEKIIENKILPENKDDIDDGNKISPNYFEERIEIDLIPENVNLEKEENKKIKFSFEDIKEQNFDIDYLKKILRPLQSKSKVGKEKHLHNLLEIQSFQADSQQILVAKLSYGGKYLATGGASGILKIWSIYSEEESLSLYEGRGILTYFKFLNENPHRSYTEHKKEIIDIKWHIQRPNLLISASLDKTVILWNIDEDKPMSIHEHPAIVSAISFCPISNDNIFVSGCLDRFVRIWNPIKNKVLDYINIQEFPISIEYFPVGNYVAVGSHNGKCSVYETIPKLKYSYSFFCKNKAGKYSDGRKITSIEFLNKCHVLITTNDSSIRLVDINDGKQIQKYKGLKNDDYMIRASFEEIYDLVISASDDGYVYVWKKVNQASAALKNKSYEYFKPFENKETSSCSLFANDISLSAYIKKILSVTQKFFIKSLIINTSNTGKLQVLINAEI